MPQIIFACPRVCGTRPFHNATLSSSKTVVWYRLRWLHRVFFKRVSIHLYDVTRFSVYSQMSTNLRNSVFDCVYLVSVEISLVSYRLFQVSLLRLDVLQHRRLVIFVTNIWVSEQARLVRDGYFVLRCRCVCGSTAGITPYHLREFALLGLMSIIDGGFLALGGVSSFTPTVVFVLVEGAVVAYRSMLCSGRTSLWWSSFPVATKYCDIVCLPVTPICWMSVCPFFFSNLYLPQVVAYWQIITGSI